MSEDFQKNTTIGKASTFAAKEKSLKQMGGEKQIAKQHDSGKLTTRKQLAVLFAEDIFRKYSSLFNIAPTSLAWIKKKSPQMASLPALAKSTDTRFLQPHRISPARVEVWEKCMLKKYEK